MYEMEILKSSMLLDKDISASLQICRQQGHGYEGF